MVIYSSLAEKRTSRLEQVLEVREQMVLEDLAEIARKMDGLETEKEMTWLYFTGSNSLAETRNTGNKIIPIGSRARLERIGNSMEELQAEQNRVLHTWKWEKQQLQEAISNQRLY